MTTNKIFTFGDGFATGHIWPEWPQILQALLPDYVIVNNAGIGAGTEWLVTQLVHCLPEMHNSRAIFQWSSPHRFDKLIEDSSWNSIIESDSVYYFNRVETFGQTWWLSSGSLTEAVKHYRDHYIQKQQFGQRQQNYQTLVQNTLENINCLAHYMYQPDYDHYSRSERFKEIRQNEVQPSPIVHYHYVVENLLPGIQLISDRQEQLKTLIYQQKWIAYDPDRDQIWQDLIKQLP
jgi:hypothetical protein